MEIRIARIAGVVVAGVCVACAGPSAHLRGAIERVAVADPAVGAFAWSPSRRLTWADFQGPPDFRSDAVATTAYVVSYSTECDDGVLTAQVVSKFLPKVSWVKAQHLMIRQSNQTLQHEQTHFDLSEVHVRQSRQALRDTPDPCRLTDAERDRLFVELGRRDAEIQQRYDRDTAHGTNRSQQQIWERQVDSWLRALSR